MLSRQSVTARKVRPRSLQHLNVSRQTTSHRVFTHNAHLLLLARHTPRPQLPYLSQPAFRRPRSLNGPSQHLARLLSTETRQFVGEQTWLAVKWTAIGWTFLVLGAVSYFGIRLAIDETANPTPEEWSFSTRQFLRAARLRMDPKTSEETGYTDWAKIGSDLKQALDHLENIGKEGKDLVEPVEGEGILIPGVGKAGFDISAKSWPWRAGYFEVIMGCGKAAEHLDGMVLDTTRSMVFPRDVMIGPSNPDPRPTPQYMKAAPLEENCVAPYPGPETFYMRVLTGKGFTTKQKIDAALAYANWLEFKRLPESAEEMYKWAVDIAVDGSSTGADRQSVSDTKTGTLGQGIKGQHASTNLLRTSTELAVHFARNGNVAQALPIFLSVLRARRESLVSTSLQSSASSTSSTSNSGIFSIFGSLFRAPVFPSPPPSGDDPFVRASEQPSCNESELMLYIGEILFSTSPTSPEGAGWTQQAVTIAEANLQRKSRLTDSEYGQTNRKCKDCLVTGVANWETMLQRLRNQLEEANEKQQQAWFSGSKVQENEKKLKGLQDELVQVADIRERVVREGIDEKFGRSQSANPSGVWIG